MVSPSETPTTQDLPEGPHPWKPHMSKVSGILTNIFFISLLLWISVAGVGH